MNNKTLIVAGISALAISALSVSGLVSAANVTTNSSNTSSATQSKSIKGMRGNMKGGEMKKGNFGLGMGGQFGKEHKGGQGMFGSENSAIKAAIDANDYNAFKIAWNTDTNKPADATLPTQDQFTKIVEQSKKHAAVEAALKANDYDAFVKATTPTKEEFALQVARYKTRTALETAIKANDYNAFKTVWESDTNRPADATLPTQDQFTKMVERATTTKNQ